MCFEDGTEKRAGTMSPNARTSQWHNDMQHTSYACVLSSGLLAFIQQRRHSHLNDDDNVPLLVEAEEMASFQVTISHTSPYHSSTHHCLCWTSCRKEPARHDPVKYYTATDYHYNWWFCHTGDFDSYCILNSITIKLLISCETAVYWHFMTKRFKTRFPALTNLN